MSVRSIAARIDRARLAFVAEGLMVAVAVSLPWSTSATSILIIAWLLAFIPTLELSDFRRELMTWAGGLPILLVLLGALGMAWADVSLSERLGGLDGFLKLPIIPLLMAQFYRSNNATRVFLGFVLSCVALLIASCVVTIWPSISHSAYRGVPVKNYIAQSDEFTVCAAALIGIATERLSMRDWGRAVSLFVVACLFLVDIFFVTTARTTLVIIAALFLVFGLREAGWRGFFGAAVVGAVFAGILWVSSPYLRERVIGVYTESMKFEIHDARTSSGERIDFWTKSLGFIESAPLFGHGTGSITEMFRHAAVGKTGVRSEVSSNPHNQTFMVAIQIGLVGAMVLWAMWVSQLMLFRGPGLVAWFGTIFVVQNMVGSLFNSFISDFTEGWLFALGVGVAGGMIQQQLRAATGRRDKPS